MIAPTGLRPGRYLTFHLGASHYGVPIRAVREVVRMCPVTVVPLMPPHVRGVVNLRGNVLPVFDLRAKFGMAEVEYTDRACIVFFDMQGASRHLAAIGTIVDGVDDVVMLGESQLNPPPDFAGAVESAYLLGVGSTAERSFTLLQMQNILVTEGSVTLPAFTSTAAARGPETP
jgi:purine-binding chemotaxis protein CheW